MYTVLAGLIAWGVLCRWMRNSCESDDTNLSEDPTDYAGWDNSDFTMDD